MAGAVTIDDVHERLLANLPPTETALEVMEFLASASPAPVVTTDGKAIVLDLGVGSMALGEPLSGLPTERFAALIERAQLGAGTRFAFGRWGEPRDVYASELFAEDGVAGMRNVHMGVDLFCAPETAVHAPLAGTVHIKANNTAELDYGPMLVLRHETPAGAAFFTLYGHLSSAGVGHLREGQSVAAGERIAAVGAPPENGNWPPHLHLQLILDLLDRGRDFPGVAYPSQREIWLALSPSPSMAPTTSADGSPSRLLSTRMPTASSSNMSSKRVRPPLARMVVFS